MLREQAINPDYFADMMLKGAFEADYQALFCSQDLKSLTAIGLDKQQMIDAFELSNVESPEAMVVHVLQTQYPQFIPNLIVYAESVLKDYVQNAKNKPLGFRVGMMAKFGWQWDKIDYLPRILQMPAAHDMDKYITLVDHIAPTANYEQRAEITERLHTMLGFLKGVQEKAPSCFNCLRSAGGHDLIVSNRRAEAASVQLPKRHAASIPLDDTGGKENAGPYNPQPK